jgi:fibro-slime domain-containing protein
MSAFRLLGSARGAIPLVGTVAIAVLAQPALAPPGGHDPDDTIALIGVVRDFRSCHPDFDVVPPDGYGHYMWNIATSMNEDNRPVYVGGGYKVLTQAHDTVGRPICWTLYNPADGDTPAEPDGPDTGSITSAETFDQWFKDGCGVNMSTLVTLTGVMQEDGEYEGLYEVNIPQFYPIDDQLFGNEGDDHNYFFTFTIVAEFQQDVSKNYILMFKSDDDAYVFITGPGIPQGGRLIADLGGINGSPEQWVQLNRLGLNNDETYQIYFFKANRNDASSRLHLVTNVPFTSQAPTTILAAFD